MRLSHRQYSLFLGVLLLMSGCVTKPEIIPPGNILETGDYIVVPVYYGTDRVMEGDRRYGYKRGETVTMGMCMVSIPWARKPGQSSISSMWRADDPVRNIVLQKTVLLDNDRYFSNLRQEIKLRKEVLVYVHGFNSSFEDAARSMGQIKYDLGFNGLAVFFSWPSKGDISPTGYVHDKDIIGASAKHLRDFLKELMKSGAESIHIIAHSMGNVAFLQALADLSRELPFLEKPVLGEVMLIAPDMNVDAFKLYSQELRKMAKRSTLYASSKDKALMISKEVHSGLPRAGEAGDGIVVLPDLDTIDVSDVDTSLLGHSYFGESSPVITDMANLLKGLPPSKRSLILKPYKNMKYWSLHPLSQ